MARDFSARTDIDNTNPTDFPSGRIRNSTSPAANDGTAIVEEVLGDLLQLALKLLRDASITPSGSADTDSTSQYLQALNAKIVETLRATPADVNNRGSIELAELLEVQAGTNTTAAVTPATLAGLTATVSRRGLIELSTNGETTTGTSTQTSLSPANLRSQIATFAEVNAGSSTTALITPGRLNNSTLVILNDTSSTIRTNSYDIGDWNMDSTTNVNIAHGLGADWQNVIHAQAMILDDTSQNLTPLYAGGAVSILSTNIRLARDNAGIFDNTAYDSTSFNRGRVFIHYLDLNP